MFPSQLSLKEEWKSAKREKNRESPPFNNPTGGLFIEKTHFLIYYMLKEYVPQTTSNTLTHSCQEANIRKCA